jgi:hypothetical protein
LNLSTWQFVLHTLLDVLFVIGKNATTFQLLLSSMLFTIWFHEDHALICNPKMLMVNVVAKELLNMQIGDSTLLIFPFSLLLLCLFFLSFLSFKTLQNFNKSLYVHCCIFKRHRKITSKKQLHGVTIAIMVYSQLLVTTTFVIFT